MTENFIIHQKARKYQWTGDCFLSVKSFFGGSAYYQVGQRAYNVDHRSFLILNECTHYNLTIDGRAETESFCVFFSPDFVRNTVSEFSATDEQLLDLNLRQPSGIRLFEKRYAHKGAVSQLLLKGRSQSNCGMSQIEKDEFYLHLLHAIFWQNHNSFNASHRLQFKKKSTRQEIFQRVCFVKDYIESNYAKNMSLNELSKVGCLSQNHLLRNFKRVTGYTPFQYISQKRIQEAKRQILESNRPIKDIASSVGYSSYTNFCSYFKHITGQSPGSLRKSDI